MMFWGNHMGFGGWSFLLNSALWIGLIVLGIWLLARLFPAGGRSRHDDDDATATTDTPLEIVRRRYARGELSKEEYETMRHDLSTS